MITQKLHMKKTIKKFVSYAQNMVNSGKHQPNISI